MRKSLLHENSALRSKLQAQPALCGGAGSPRPPATSPYKGGFTMTVSLPPGVQGGYKVCVPTPIGMATAIVPGSSRATPSRSAYRSAVDADNTHAISASPHF